MSKDKIVYLASDHGGIMLKQFIADELILLGYPANDLGPHQADTVDYPEYAKKLCVKIQENQGSRGILICGTGIGMSMAANKFKGIRAALCLNEYMAIKSREHNDANVLCLGERVLGRDLAKSIVLAWLKGEFEGGRHERRVNMIEQV